jgi:hypothetical protein
MKPQSCKGKGRRFQQKIARSILDAFPPLKEDDVRSTSMGAQGEDILLSTHARTILPLSIECKCVEKINIWDCLEQTKKNSRDDVSPCLVFSRNRSPSYAVVEWETLLSLYKSIHRSSEEGEVPERVVALIEEMSSLVQRRKVSSSVPSGELSGECPLECGNEE